MRMSAVFFQLLAHLGVGGLLALALVPAGQASRGFFRFSALVYAALVAVALAIARPEQPGALALLAAAGLVAAAYVLLAPRLPRGAGRALLSLAAICGLAGALLPDATAGAPLRAAATGASAALLGSVMAAMVLGHWYLVMPGQPVDPLLRLSRVYFAAVVARAALVVVAIALLPSGSRAVAALLDGHAFFFWPRCLFGLVLPLLLAFMVLPTVKANDTQPATGMLYVAAVLVLMGEGVAKYLGSVTAVPV